MYCLDCVRIVYVQGPQIMKYPKLMQEPDII